MEAASIASVSIRRICSGIPTIAEDALAIEAPLGIQLQYGAEHIVRNISITMRTPGSDIALAAGFLFTEGIIRHTNVKGHLKFEQVSENVLRVLLPEGELPFLQQSERNFFSNSSCGVCGKVSIESLSTELPFGKIKSEYAICGDILHDLPQKLEETQRIFHSTGGLHAAALFDTAGNIQQLFEDIGRHNALDKLIGHALLDGLLPLEGRILLLSGRAGYELIQKAAMAGIGIVASVGAPSSMAVDMARNWGITLVGFLRADRFNIYTHEQRILINNPNSPV